MELKITKSDFERAVPAAREPKGRIFEYLEDAFIQKAEQLSRELLGETGAQACDADGVLYREPLCYYVKQLVCLEVFLEKMRSLDLILTSTGFGVVSTQDTAPASKMRVDALEGELRRRARGVRCHVLANLYKVPGWSSSQQRRENVETLFWDFHLLERYAAISNPKPEDWDVNVPEMLAADSFLKKHIGSRFMEALLTEVTSDKVKETDIPVVTLCQKFIGAWIAKNHRLKEELYMQLINYMESNIASFPLYAESDAYRLNHFKPYENHAEDTAFHFLG